MAQQLRLDALTEDRVWLLAHTPGSSELPITPIPRIQHTTVAS